MPMCGDELCLWIVVCKEVGTCAIQFRSWGVPPPNLHCYFNSIVMIKFFELG